MNKYFEWLHKTDFTALAESAIHKLFYLALITAACLSSGSAIISMGFDCNGRAQLANMIGGTAERPFVTRALVPQSIRIISEATPADFKEFFDSIPAETGLVEKIEGRWIPDDAYSKLVKSNMLKFVDNGRFYDYLLGALALCIPAFLFGIYFRKLLRVVYRSRNLFYDLTALLATLLTSVCFIEGFYIYDFMTLFLSTLFVYYLVKEKWIHLAIVFTVFAFHKETCIFFLALFAVAQIYWPRLDGKKFILIGAYMLAVFAASRIVLMAAFAGNPGSNLEFHLFRNLIFFMTRFELTTAIAYVLLLVILFRNWSAQPKPFKLYFYLSFGIFSAGLFFGFAEELRQYYEVYPAAIALISRNLMELAGADISVNPKYA